MSNRLWSPRRLPGRAKVVSFWDPALHSTAAKDKKDRVAWTSSTSGVWGGPNTAPTFSGSAFGGPAHGYDFDGTANVLDRALPSSLIGNDVPLSVVGAVIADDVTTQNDFWSISGGSTVPGVFILGFLSGKPYATKRGESGSSQILTPVSGTWSTGTIYVVTFLHAGTTSDLLINGVTAGPFTSGGAQDANAITAPTRLMLGMSSTQGVTNNHYFNGRIGPFATFAGLLTANEAAAQTRACMRRVGL